MSVFLHRPNVCFWGISAVISLVCLLGMPRFVPDVYAGMLARRGVNFIPAPRLLYPVTDDIALAQKDSLEFRWARNGIIDTESFDFRIYKGYNTTADNLIFKQMFSADVYPIKVPASLFENGQVYTWVLIRIVMGGQKSDKGFSSFKIISK